MVVRTSSTCVYHDFIVVYPGSITVHGCLGSIMVLSWIYQFVVSIMVSWFYPGSLIVFSWFFHGSFMDLPGFYYGMFYHGSIRVLSWFCHGSLRVLSKTTEELRLSWS